MKKLNKKWQIILYGCSGLGVNMLNLIVGSYLCSALLTGGFETNVERWTYLNKDLVIYAVWGILVFGVKVFDGIVDLPMSSFTENLRTKWGKRRPSILIGYVPMILAYFLFLIPLDSAATLRNTIWFAVILAIYYGFYTLTMVTYYATYAEIVETPDQRLLLSNTKSVCDVVYFIFGFALLPVFVNLGMNIRIVALIFFPLVFTMLIALFMIKEKSNKDEVVTEKVKSVSLVKSISITFKNKDFIIWLCVHFVMNFGLQLFLSGINEFFSTAGLNMTFVMAAAFAPVPFTLILYNKVVKKKGFRFAFQYILAVFAVSMALMFFCNNISDTTAKLIFAVICGLLCSFSIGSFFSVAYMIPAHIAAENIKKTNVSNPSMFFAVQGLFEGVSAGTASGLVLVYLKEHGLVSYMTLIVSISCIAALFLAFILPKSIVNLGKH